MGRFFSTTTLVNWQPRTIKGGEWEKNFRIETAPYSDTVRMFTHKISPYFWFYISDEEDCQESRMEKWTDTCFTVLHDYMVAPNLYDDLYVETIGAVVGNTETNEFFEIWREQQNNGKKKIIFYG